MTLATKKGMEMKQKASVLRNRGVTIVELMVVVGIIAIIAAFAYPSYTTQVMHSNRMDAKRYLMQISSVYERYYVENQNTYNGVVTSVYSAMSITSGPPTSSFYTFTCTSCTSTSYTLVASAKNNQAADSCVNFYLTNTGSRTATVSGCW